MVVMRFRHHLLRQQPSKQQHIHLQAGERHPPEERRLQLPQHQLLALLITLVGMDLQQQVIIQQLLLQPHRMAMLHPQQR